MANFVYVDNSNIWIEGTHVSAVVKGLAPNIGAAQTRKISDLEWKLDFAKLYEFVAGDRSQVGRAILFGSTPPANEGLWAEARRGGFEVMVFDRNTRNREKKVDTSIATAMLSDSYEVMTAGVDEVTLVAGDADYVPTVEHLRSRGFDVYVAFWDHAARELRDVCTGFISLNDYLEHLRFGSSKAQVV